MSEENKTIARRWFEDLWNKGNLSVADEILAPTYTHHDASTPDVGRGPESEKKRATLYRTAFPDLHLSIDDMIAEGDRVAIRWTCRGIHKGDLSGIAPTGKTFTLTGVSISRFAGGKAMERWVNWDALGIWPNTDGQTLSVRSRTHPETKLNILFHGQHLLAARSRQLEDANLPGRHQEESCARVAFAKQ